VVNNPAQYPSVARLHATFHDLLTMTLPPEVAKWAEHLVHLPRIPFYEEARTYLLILARHAENPQLRALYRFIAMDSELRRRVPIEDLSLLKIAEEEVDYYKTNLQENLDVREFHLVLASALCQLASRSREIKEALARCHRDVREAMERRALLDTRLAEMDSADALLIRNVLAPELGVARIKIERLQHQHPMLLGNKKRNSIDQRTHRLEERIRKDGMGSVKRKGSSLLDIITTADAKREQPRSKRKKKEPVQ